MKDEENDHDSVDEDTFPKAARKFKKVQKGGKKSTKATTTTKNTEKTIRKGGKSGNKTRNVAFVDCLQGYAFGTKKLGTKTLSTGARMNFTDGTANVSFSPLEILIAVTPHLFQVNAQTGYSFGGSSSGGT